MSNDNITDISVRMYNVGFGDAFLLRYKYRGRLIKMLIDCGCHISGRGPESIKTFVEMIIEECRDADDKVAIDVVVATHRHYDHISGFAYRQMWSEVNVKEVWMPWTENPKDAQGRRITEGFKKRAKRLINRLERMQADEKKRLDRKPANQRNVERFKLLQLLHEVALNAASNEDAMGTLHTGFAGAPERQFLPIRRAKNSVVQAFTSKALPGAKVHVLGPSFDPKVIADLDPPHDEHYLWFDLFAMSPERQGFFDTENRFGMLVAPLASGSSYEQVQLQESAQYYYSSSERLNPAQKAPKVTANAKGKGRKNKEDKPQREPDDDEMPPPSTGTGLSRSELLREFDDWALKEEEMYGAECAHLVLSKEQRNVIHEVLMEGSELAATSLDNAVNGSSLMFMLKLGEHYMLFPGDAQWGTWEQVLTNDDALNLLRKTTFLKVGHHGSHNATPKTFVEDVIEPACIAAVCTKKGTKDWDIPQPDLMKALRSRIEAVVRSDKKDAPDPSSVTRNKLWVEFNL